MIFILYWEKLRAVLLIWNDHDLRLSFIVDRLRRAKTNWVHDKVRLAQVALFGCCAFVAIWNISITSLTVSRHRFLTIIRLELVVSVSAYCCTSHVAILRTISKLVFAINTFHLVVFVHLIWIKALHILIP
jgi:hypothetical protein